VGSTNLVAARLRVDLGEGVAGGGGEVQPFDQYNWLADGLAEAKQGSRHLISFDVNDQTKSSNKSKIFEGIAKVLLTGQGG